MPQELSSLAAAEELGLIQLIRWKLPEELLETQYGLIRISEWLRKEKSRIENAPNRTAAVVGYGGEMALFVNPFK